MVKRAHSLLALYEESGVPHDKLIFRVPATWAGIQAAGQLEKEGVATQAFHIYRYPHSSGNESWGHQGHWAVQCKAMQCRADTLTA